MKKIILCFSLWLLYACNSEPKSTVETNPSGKSDSIASVVDGFAPSEKLKNDPSYTDSMKQAAKRLSDKVSGEIAEQQKNYTQEDWEREYTLNGQYYISLENVDIRYNDNYEPIMSLTIHNQTGLVLKSIKLIVDGRLEKSGTDDNIFTFKTIIPAKGKTNVSFKVRDNVTVRDVYFYSFVTNNGRLSESRIALNDYVRKVYPK